MTPGLLAILGVTILGAASRDCPSPCKCYPEDADCSNKSLTFLRNAMFNWTGAERLSELSLENNQLTSFPAHIFDPLVGLKTLNLNHNQLQVLEVGVFSKLRNLKFLDMKDNHLTTLPVGLFDFQNKLISLDLRNNLLTTLDVNAVSSLLSLDVFAIKGNPLICDCTLQPVVHWSLVILENNDAVCRSPPQYRGLSWYVLTGVLCSAVSTTVNTTPSTDSLTAIDLEMSTSFDDNSTELSSYNDTQKENDHVNVFSGGSIIVVAVSLLCIIVFAVALVLIFWYRRLSARVTNSSVPNSEQDKGLEEFYDDINIEGHYEYSQIGNKEGKSCTIDSDHDTVRYVLRPCSNV